MRYSQLPNFARNGAVEFIVDLTDAIALQNLDVEILALNDTKQQSRLPKGSVTVRVALGEETSRLRRTVPVRWIRQAMRAPVQFVKIFRSALRSDVIILTCEMGSALLLPSKAAYIRCQSLRIGLMLRPP